MKRQPAVPEVALGSGLSASLHGETRAVGETAMAPGRIVVTPCAPRAARSALLATGHLSRASAREVSQRLGFEPTRRTWSFRVCGVDFAI